MPSYDQILENIDPFIRFVKIDKSNFLSGRWIDYDNVFTIIASGKANFILDGKSYDTVKGDVIIMSPGVLHIIKSEESQQFMEYVFHFDLYSRNSCDFPAHEIINARRDGIFYRNEIKEEEKALSCFPSVIRPDDNSAIHMKSIFLDLHREFIEKNLVLK